MLFPITDTFVWEPMIFGMLVDGQPSSQCAYEMGHDYCNADFCAFSSLKCTIDS